MRRLPLRGIFRVDDARSVVMRSHACGVVIDDDSFPLAVDVERLGPRLAEAVARVLDAAKRHVRPRAVGRAVDRHEPGAIPRDELLDTMAVRRVNRPGQAESYGVGVIDR